jgi:uncharacterized protein (AIM24 family)
MPSKADLVREHQFLAATGNLDYTFNRVKGVSNMLLGSTGFFVDRFSASPRRACSGSMATATSSRRSWRKNEQIDIEPGGWVYRVETVRMAVQMFGLKTGIFGGGGNMIWNRFTGPGRVGIQSMYLHMLTNQ